MKYRCIIKYILHDLIDTIKPFIPILTTLTLIGCGVYLIMRIYPVAAVIIFAIIISFLTLMGILAIRDYLKDIYTKCKQS